MAEGLSAYGEAYNAGWDAAVAKLSAFIERERERMIGREMRAVVAQMALIADLAAEMGLERVWGMAVSPWPQPEHEVKEKRDGDA